MAMNLRFIIAVVSASVVAASFASGQEARKAGDNPRAVLPHSRRVDALAKADELLAIHPADSEALVATLGDPFYPGAKRPKDKKSGAGAEQPVELPTEQLLARAAESIRPQGTMLIGSEPYLLLDGRRYKSGDSISVNIDGLGVQVTVSSIQRNSYTLRLNDQELRREFK
jgi:Ni/Co efflux regulator RcnB